MNQNINDFLAKAEPSEIAKAVTKKRINVPQWAGIGGLREQYEPTLHPVMNKAIYPDITSGGRIVKVTRTALGLQKLAVKRMAELVTGIPIKRSAKPTNEKHKEIAEVLAKVFEKNRIDSLDVDRCRAYFAACEAATLWYAVEQPNTLYGRSSPIKLRSRNLSPMIGTRLYPLFDAYDDMIALTIAYEEEGEKGVRTHILDVYTDKKHLRLDDASGTWSIVEDENITLGKIPAIYMHRSEPIWEDQSQNIYEMEWSLSRNGNYLRENSKPLFVVYANEEINFDEEKRPEEEGRAILNYPEGSRAEYVTWQQGTEALKLQIYELRTWFFKQLQLPDWSYEKLSSTPMSGEARKQLFIDAHLKVKDESGALIEFFDREVNVLREFLKVIFTADYHADIEALPIEILITPYTIDDESQTINNLLNANGNKPLVSQREAIELLGWSANPDKTLEEIAREEMGDALEPSI